MRRVLNPDNRRWLLSALLVALIARFLIPAGFMPAANFSFQICPDGFPAHLLKGAEHPHADHQHHHPPDPDSSGDAHRHSTAGTKHCAFAAAAGAGPAAWTPAFFTAAVDVATPEFVYVSPALPPLSFRVQQPRAPPALS